ncbi:unnamed protein product [Caretta caretta]
MINEEVVIRLIAVDTHEQKTHARYPAHESMHQSVELMVSLIAMNVCCVQKSCKSLNITFGITESMPDCRKYKNRDGTWRGGCLRNYAPVCGTDGITHSNECLLCEKIFETGVPIGIKRKGEC